jgi:hypothetical protein
MALGKRRRSLRKHRRSPRWPAPTLSQFANKVGTTETIIRGLVRSGQIPSVECNGVLLIPPAGEARFRELYGPTEPSGDTAA